MVFIGKILLIRYTINQCSIVCGGGEILLIRWAIN